MWVRRGSADDTDDLQAMHILDRLETWPTAEMSIYLSCLSAYRSFAVRELHIVYMLYPERRIKLHSALIFFVSYLCQLGRRLLFLCNLVKVYSPLLWYKKRSNSQWILTKLFFELFLRVILLIFVLRQLFQHVSLQLSLRYPCGRRRSLCSRYLPC